MSGSSGRAQPPASGSAASVSYKARIADYELERRIECFPCGIWHRYKYTSIKVI